MIFKDLAGEISEYSKTLIWYGGRKAAVVAAYTEGAKDVIVEVLKTIPARRNGFFNGDGGSFNSGSSG